MHRYRLLITSLAIILFATACSSDPTLEVTATQDAPEITESADETDEADPEEDATPDEPATAEPAPEETPPPEEVPTAEPDPTAVPDPTAAPKPAPTVASPDGDESLYTLPGCGEFEGFTNPGDILAVVGLDWQETDSTFNTLQIYPGADETASHVVANDREDIVATGEGCLLPTGLWYQVTADGVTGWAPARHLGYLAGEDDATAEIVAAYGSIPAGSVLNVVTDVIAHHSSEEPPSRTTRLTDYDYGDLIDVTIDVLDLGDDSLMGWRLHIFIAEAEDSDDVYLKSVERTAICGRGVTDDNLCL